MVKRVTIMRLLYLFTITCIFVSICTPFAFANECFSLPIIEEIELPENFSFFVRSTQTDHNFFEQAAAQKDGTFAICSRFTRAESDAFSKVYVDIFEPNGAFWKEISFFTQFEVTIELRDNSLNLLFYDYMITIDLITEEVMCFAIAPNSLRESGLYRSLHQDQFTCGEWTYRCQKSIWGYSELVRSNGEREQILVSYSGMELFFVQNLISVVLIILPLSIIVFFVYRFRKNRYKQ